MKRLSYQLFCLLLLWAVCFSGKSVSKPSHKAETMYYWFRTDDVYLDFMTTDDEINELENSLGVWVDTSPFGGTLLERGYTNNLLPHTVWPTVLLYGHF